MTRLYKAAVRRRPPNAATSKRNISRGTNGAYARLTKNTYDRNFGTSRRGDP
jgi:hypothetical protein